MGRPFWSLAGETIGVLTVAVAMVAALGLSLATGGSLRRLPQLRLRRWPLTVVAAAAQAAGAVVAAYGLLSDDAALVAYATGVAVSAVLVAAFLIWNLHLAGMGLVTAGLLLNAVVVLLNGAMPVSLEGAARAGVATGPIAGGEDPRHEVAGERTRLEWLGDWVPAPWPVRPEVLSPGDVLLAAGLAQLVFAAARPPVGRRARVE